MLHFASQVAADRHVLAQQIQALESRRRLTSAQTARLASVRQQLSALAAPVYKLPDHLLSMIFECGAESEEEGEEAAFSFLVSHVVSRWRRVALQTPRLWSSVEISVPTGRARRPARWSAALERSKCSDLTLYVKITQDMTPRAILTMEDLIRPLYARCKSFHLWSVVKVEPITSIPLPFSTGLVHLALTNIKCINPTSGEQELQPLLDALSACRRLEKLELYFIKAARADPISPIELPSLRSITVVDSHDSFMCYDIVSSIRATLHDVVVSGSVSYRGILTFPENPNALGSIRFLMLRRPVFTTRFAMQLLAHMPELENLGLCNVTFGWDPEPPSLPFCSKLATVICDQCEEIDGLRTLVEVVSSGSAKRTDDEGSKLDIHMMVRRCTPMTDELCDWLRQRVAVLQLPSSGPDLPFSRSS